MVKEERMENQITLNSQQGIYAGQIKDMMITIAKNKLALGQKLVDAKKYLDHGEFLPMLESIGMASSTANDYIQLSKLAITNMSEISAISLDNFNNSQLKKLDNLYKEDKTRTLEIIKSGTFPKVEKKTTPNTGVKEEDVIEGEYEDSTPTPSETTSTQDELKDGLIDILYEEIAELKAEVARLKARYEPSQVDRISQEDVDKAITLAGSKKALAEVIGVSADSIRPSRKDNIYSVNLTTRIYDFLKKNEK